MDSTCILIGVGGSGGRLVRQISSYAAASRSHGPLRTLSIDTDTESDSPWDDHFSLGGFQLRPSLDRLRPDIFPAENLAALRSLDLFVNMGAAARADIGRVALELHRGPLETWLLGNIQKSINNSATMIRIIVVGSVCGGTGAGVLPEMGSLMRSVLDRRQTTGVIYGFGLGVSFFERTSYPALARSLSHNQDYSVKRLLELGRGDGLRGYDDFHLVDVLPDSGLELEEFFEAVARRIVAGWFLEHSSSESPSVLSGYKAGGLGVSAGVTLLSISGFESTDVDLLWTPGSQLSTLASAPGSLPVAEPAFYIPRFRRFWSEQIAQLRALIHKPDVSEPEIQEFLEANPKFLTGFDYERAVPHLYLSSRQEGDLIPDFLLVPFASDLADVLELKHPRRRLMVSQSGHARISASLLHAIAQLRDYEEYFDREENRERIRALYGFTAYKPKLTVVIGTRNGIESELAFRKVTAAHSGVNVITYDDILERASRWLR